LTGLADRRSVLHVSSERNEREEKIMSSMNNFTYLACGTTTEGNCEGCGMTAKQCQRETNKGRAEAWKPTTGDYALTDWELAVIADNS
jgi:hypothetical protein